MDKLENYDDMPDVESESVLLTSKKSSFPMDSIDTDSEIEDETSFKHEDDEENEELKLSDVMLSLSSDREIESDNIKENIFDENEKKRNLSTMDNDSSQQKGTSPITNSKIIDGNHYKEIRYHPIEKSQPYYESNINPEEKRFHSSSESFGSSSGSKIFKKHSSSPISHTKPFSYKKSSLVIDPSGPFDELEKKKFLDDLYSFMEYQGQPITKVPSLGFQELDLYKLYKAVLLRGGMDEVTRAQEWKLVYLDLGIPTMSTSASYNTRTNYKKYLYLYELEHFQPSALTEGQKKEQIASFKFDINDFIKIESTLHGGQVYYASILKRRQADDKGEPMYYVHYNGWSSSHDEWMPEYALTPLSEEESISPEELVNPSPTRSSKSNYLIYDPNLIQSRFMSPRKKTKFSSSTSSQKSGSGSSARSTSSSQDEWTDSFDEGGIEKLGLLSPNKIKFKLGLDMDRRKVKKEGKPTPFFQDHLEYFEKTKNILKGISEVDEHEDHLKEGKERSALQGLHILHPNQDNYYENNGGSTDEEVPMKESARVPFTPRRSNRSTSAAVPTVTSKSIRSEPIQLQKSVPPAASAFSYHSPMMDTYYHQSHSSYSSDESPLAFRNRERREKMQFDRLPLKEDTKPINQYTMHYNRFGSEPFIGLLESIDFIDAMKALNEEAIQIKNERSKENSLAEIGRKSFRDENFKNMSYEELSALKASIAKAEKRLDEIRSEYYQCTAYLSDLKRQQKLSAIVEREH